MRRDPDALVLATINASWRRTIDAPTLLGCIRDLREIQTWLPHLATMFSEVSLEALLRWMTAHDISPAVLGRCYEQVAALTGERNPMLEAWLGDMAEPAPERLSVHR
jgi:hypothetical protein